MTAITPIPTGEKFLTPHNAILDHIVSSPVSMKFLWHFQTRYRQKYTINRITKVISPP
ncbi:hypothetical protein D3C84_1045990 [compost metagenome]